MFDSLVLSYIDPLTGSLVLQVIVAALLTTGVMCRRYLSTILALPFRLGHGGSVREEQATHEDTH